MSKRHDTASNHARRACLEENIATRRLAPSLLGMFTSETKFPQPAPGSEKSRRANEEEQA